MKYLAGLILLLASSQSFAVVYEFESNNYWAYIYNKTTGDWPCNSKQANVCDVEPGEYLLISYKPTGTTRQDITIQDQLSDVVLNECTFDSVDKHQACSAECPAGKVIERIRKCYANASSAHVGTNFVSDDTKAWCNVGAHDGPVRIIVEVGCK